MSERSLPEARWLGIRLAIFDVDGVLTDGRLLFDAEGRESKAFHVRDGHGLKMLQKAGIEIAFITARYSPALAYRAQDLGIRRVYQGSLDKRLAYRELKLELNLENTAIAYMGDDLIDLPILTSVGLAACPGDAHPEVLARVHWRAQAPGGGGAVREFCEAILKAQGHWTRLLEPYLQEGQG
ncbi:MAG: KdsC family phosphatase [Acidithiobacillus sp.]